MHYDVFNGDADGIIALLQLRWAEPKPDSVLVTGVKRDISLLKKVGDDATTVTVLDISMEKNAKALVSLLLRDVAVEYFDHHRCGDIPQQSNLAAHIDLSADTCTSLLVNAHLQGQFEHWAIAAAFGDNLQQVAREKAEQIGLSDDEIAFLQELGTLINYNGYGATLSDLHIAPANLFKALQAYPNPFALRDDLSSPYYYLKAGYAEDMAKVTACQPFHETQSMGVYMLPAAPWARRISGVFSNDLANAEPVKAHAVLIKNNISESDAEDSYLVSVRAPLSIRAGADEVCSQFPTGGGRRAAAGINALPASSLDTFLDVLDTYYQNLL